MNELREHLADLAHAQWAGWMKYLFSKCQELPDGSLSIPPALMARWTRQMSSEYRSLPENERDSDRVEADKMISRFDYAAPAQFPASADDIEIHCMSTYSGGYHDSPEKLSAFIHGMQTVINVLRTAQQARTPGKVAGCRFLAQGAHRSPGPLPRARCAP